MQILRVIRILFIITLLPLTQIKAAVTSEVLSDQEAISEKSFASADDIKAFIEQIGLNHEDMVFSDFDETLAYTVFQNQEQDIFSFSPERYRQGFELTKLFVQEKLQDRIPEEEEKQPPVDPEDIIEPIYRSHSAYWAIKLRPPEGQKTHDLVEALNKSKAMLRVLSGNRVDMNRQTYLQNVLKFGPKPFPLDHYIHAGRKGQAIVSEIEKRAHFDYFIGYDDPEEAAFADESKQELFLADDSDDQEEDEVTVRFKETKIDTRYVLFIDNNEKVLQKVKDHLEVALKEGNARLKGVRFFLIHYTHFPDQLKKVLADSSYKDAIFTAMADTLRLVEKL